MPITVTRYHDISCGHRVVGHEGKCKLLHGHNYRVHFTCEAVKQDDIGRVIDFSVIKSALCMWLEDNWDHRMLLWKRDNLAAIMCDTQEIAFKESIVLVPFNPTAENMALHLLYEIGPKQLAGTGVRLFGVKIDETRKCSAEVSLR